MEYKYITENNLEHIQDYMYAQYGGNEFLRAYVQTRKTAFLGGEGGDILSLIQKAFPDGASKPSSTTAQLQALLESLYTEGRSVDRTKLDQFIKRFEVRKRLFAEYDPASQRPVFESGYAGVQNYILLAAAVEKAYCQFHSLKYLNCLLKLNDTLLSLLSSMEERVYPAVRFLVTREAGHVRELAHRKGIVLWEDEICC